MLLACGKPEEVAIKVVEALVKSGVKVDARNLALCLPTRQKLPSLERGPIRPFGLPCRSLVAGWLLVVI
jgi:hypothetical protein